MKDRQLKIIYKKSGVPGRRTYEIVSANSGETD